MNSQKMIADASRSATFGKLHLHKELLVLRLIARAVQSIIVHLSPQVLSDTSASSSFPGVRDVPDIPGYRFRPP